MICYPSIDYKGFFKILGIHFEVMEMLQITILSKFDQLDLYDKVDEFLEV